MRKKAKLEKDFEALRVAVNQHLSDARDAHWDIKHDFDERIDMLTRHLGVKIVRDTFLTSNLEVIQRKK